MKKVICFISLFVFLASCQCSSSEHEERITDIEDRIDELQQQVKDNESEIEENESEIIELKSLLEDNGIYE